VYGLFYEVGDREIAVDTRQVQEIFLVKVPAILGPTKLPIQKTIGYHYPGEKLTTHPV